jgi:hypothetical protein
LRFEIEPYNWGNFKKEFKFTNQQVPTEFKYEKPEE